VRQFRLPILEQNRDKLWDAWVKRDGGLSDNDVHTIVVLDTEIKRLRRALGVKPTPQMIGDQTRERVRAFRARR
jgi:hypothetical protein